MLGAALKGDDATVCDAATSANHEVEAAFRKLREAAEESGKREPEAG